jgi:hypothetical protein
MEGNAVGEITWQNEAAWVAEGHSYEFLSRGEFFTRVHRSCSRECAAQAAQLFKIPLELFACHQSKARL